MVSKIVRCPDCNEILYVIINDKYMTGNIIIKHGFTAMCSCGYEFNSDWIKKENAN